MQSAFQIKLTLAARFHLSASFPNNPSIWTMTAAQRILLVEYAKFDNDRELAQIASARESAKLGRDAKPEIPKRGLMRLKDLEKLGNAR